MSNFKSGSGNLTFGDDTDSTDETTSEMETESESESSGSTSPERSAEKSSEQAMSEGKDSEQSISSAGESTVKNESTSEYPYFIRRHNVGDERDVRLEIFLRDKVADREAQFRNELAKCLGTNEVSKTDAREFALLSAFQNPDDVAELMEKEGFGTFQ